MPNLKSKLTCATLLITTSGCAIIQSNRIEDMTTSYRLEFLQQKTTEELCNAYTNPWIKKETESQIKYILKNRNIEKCVKDETTRNIPYISYISTQDWQNFLPKNNVQNSEEWFLNISSNLLNESKKIELETNRGNYWKMQLMSYILLIKSSQLNNLKDQSSIRNFRSLLIENGLTEEIYNESKNNFSKTFIELIDTNKQPTIDDNNLVISNEAREEKSKKLNYKNQIKPYQIKHQEKNIHEPKQESRKEFNQNQKGKIPEDKKESSKIINEELSTKENTDIQNNNQDIKKPIKIKSLFDL